jgi:hypothetical protein
MRSDSSSWAEERRVRLRRSDFVAMCMVMVGGRSLPVLALGENENRRRIGFCRHLAFFVEMNT